MMTLDKRDQRVVLLAIGIAIEHTHKAIEACSDQRLGGSKLLDAVAEHQRTLQEFQRVRAHLIEGGPLPNN